MGLGKPFKLLELQARKTRICPGKPGKIPGKGGKSLQARPFPLSWGWNFPGKAKERGKNSLENPAGGWRIPGFLGILGGVFGEEMKVLGEPNWGIAGIGVRGVIPGFGSRKTGNGDGSSRS